MKVQIKLTPSKIQTYPYLAREKDSQRLVLVGAYSTILLETARGGNGDGWCRNGNQEHMFTPTSETVTLEND